jgi:hypothetical protein
VSIHVGTIREAEHDRPGERKRSIRERVDAQLFAEMEALSSILIGTMQVHTKSNASAYQKLGCKPLSG